MKPKVAVSKVKAVPKVKPRPAPVEKEDASEVKGISRLQVLRQRLEDRIRAAEGL